MAKPTIQFLGAAKTVTGSKFLLRTDDARVLFECGMFQGHKELRKRNWDKMPFDPSTIDAVVLTHAHIDHSGYIPRLVKMGFKGTIYCTPATAELLGLLLPDSGHLHEEEARYANKRGYSKHNPALPLYTRQEALESLAQIRTIAYGETREVAKGVDVVLHPSGHILGAAFTEVRFAGKKLVISGDIGSYEREVMAEPSPIPADADYIMVESTYGGRSEETSPVQQQLRDYIGPVLDQKGVVVIPSFAIGRTTLVLYHLRRLQETNQIADVPVYVDSPMATDAVKIYCRYGDEHNLKVSLLKSSKDCLIRAKQTFLVKKVEDSKVLNAKDGPMIIISASGMATGGRILHHLKNRLPNRLDMVLLVGYQAEGTRGRLLLDGAKKIKMLGETIPVNAKVASIRGLSAHGDGDDVVRWLKTAKSKPQQVFLVHGEEEGLRAMGERVGKELKMKYSVPSYLQKVTL
jgi:metallo-beta-lactamase family protein